ncbi:hypothetical protein F1728_15310 [Gimesia benthica]|uniref:Type I restriction endonuclease subunit M n=2 Tax=Gimesia benthica TaxID=2608982 RepID=A0A6I6APB6_9PLAN|nr:hypothetical protein F1728_15310 [Gimesia benthica]
MNNKAINKLFSLGQVVATPSALSLLDEHQKTPAEFLSRHQSGDWGELCKEDQQANDSALKHGDRIFSAYKIDDAKIWIITEADRSSTCILLPEEY